MTLPAWVQAIEDKPAPGSLLLVQAFVNTTERTERTDLLTEADAGNEWLRQSGLLGPDAAATDRDLLTAREVRESIRALIARNAHGPELSPGELAPLRALTRAARIRLAVDPAGPVGLDPGSGGTLTDGLVRLLLVIRDAQHDGTWHRLKTCGNDECQWAFYDRSHSRRGTWCDMASCGNVIKNRNLRARRSARARPAN